jgi:hypothetical protein
MKWKLRKPYLDFWFDCWLLYVRTSLMHERIEMDHFDYIYVTVQVVHKYGFRFRLYCPWHRRIS